MYKSDKNIDKKIRERFHSELSPAPQNSWFVRKVINRLPERSVSGRGAIWVWIFYALGAFAMILGWVYAIVDTIANGLTITSIIFAVALPVTTFLAIAIIAFPAIKRSL